MKYGKLQDISGVDFRLPPDPSENVLFFEKNKKPTDRKHIYIGATGYNMREWKGRWYTHKAKTVDFLKQYGTQFNGIEHNTTHYRIPDPKTISRWYEETPADFRFSPKIPQTISHRSDLGLQSGDLQRFVESIVGLKEKLGLSFMQLPPYFSTDRLGLLEQFLKAFPAEIPLSIEVRHASFYQGTAKSAAYFELLEQYGTATVITDVAGERKDLHCRVTAPFVAIRLVGNGLHPTDTVRATYWAERLNYWFDLGLETAYVFCHEPDNLLAPDYCAITGKVFLEHIKDVSLRHPTPLANMGIQGTLF